ncbi:acyl-CoA thioesterase [Cyanobium sp. Morenito 9A2]|nr:acyl-CoA thioesterase [Cyanobium sp. Morenito 9A2]
MKRGWCLRRRVLPQHTDHAGVMWHGSYLGFLEEARVEALASAGLDYSDLSARGLELPVVALSIDYRQALLHGDALELWSVIEPRRGLRLPWHSTFFNGAGQVAAAARVELVLVQLACSGSDPGARRLVRRLPEDLERAIERLELGPNGHQER